MVILEVRRVCLNIHRYDWWANLCLHKRMAKNSITYLFNSERYQFKLQILQFGIYIMTYYEKSLSNQLPNNASYNTRICLKN